jgi:hypothetical protein
LTISHQTLVTHPVTPTCKAMQVYTIPRCRPPPSKSPWNNSRAPLTKRNGIVVLSKYCQACRLTSLPRGLCKVCLGIGGLRQLNACYLYMCGDDYANHFLTFCNSSSSVKPFVNRIDWMEICRIARQPKKKQGKGHMEKKRQARFKDTGYCSSINQSRDGTTNGIAFGLLVASLALHFHELHLVPGPGV